MKQLPSYMLVKTWLFIIYYNNDEMNSQKIKLRKAIYNWFGSIELAQFYIDQMKND